MGKNKKPGFTNLKARLFSNISYMSFLITLWNITSIEYTIRKFCQAFFEFFMEQFKN